MLTAERRPAPVPTLLSYPACPHVCVQAMVESLLKEFPNVLTLRVRMPIVESLTYDRNFIAKIIKYDKVSPIAAYLHTAWASQASTGVSLGVWAAAVVRHSTWHAQPRQSKI